MSLLDIVFSSFFLILTNNIKNWYSFNVEERRMISWIFFFHTVVCFAATPILFTGGDAKGYWFIPKEQTFDMVWNAVVQVPRPTQVMHLLCYFPSNVMGLNFLSGMIMFSFLGFWAFIFILLTVKSFIPDLMELRQVTVFGFSILPYVFMLPNMHFWSVGIGKDTLLFFSVSAIIYALVNIKKRWFLIIIASLIAYYIRPHVLLFLAAGYGVAFIFSTKLNLFQKIAFGAVASMVFFPLLNNVLEFARIEEFTTEHLEDFSTSKSTALSVAGSGIDFSNYPYPLKVLTFIFRPFFFDINGIPAVVASIENLLQLLLFIFFFRNRSLKFIFKANIIVRMCFFYFFIGAFAFAPVMSNLGIIIREKNMLMPAFLIFILASIKYKLITKEHDERN